MEVIFGSLAVVALVRGVWLAVRGAPKASSWLAVGSGFLLYLATMFPPAHAVTAILFTVGATSLSAAGALLVREMAIERDRRMSLEVADDAVVRELMRDVEHDGEKRRVAAPEPTEEAGGDRR